jgi:hypothetical protein
MIGVMNDWRCPDRLNRLSVAPLERAIFAQVSFTRKAAAV